MEKAGGNGTGQANINRDIFDLIKKDLSVDLLILLGSDLDARNRLGWEIYGKALTAFDGRNFLGEAYAESLDKLPYLRAAMVEQPEMEWIRMLYVREIHSAAILKARMTA